MGQPEAPISFTADALAELYRLQAEHNDISAYLRVGTKGAGCSGYSYLLAFDDMRDDDKVFEVQGIQVVIEPKQIMYVLGLEIDFVARGNSKGFAFRSRSGDTK